MTIEQTDIDTQEPEGIGMDEISSWSNYPLGHCAHQERKSYGC